MNDEAIMENYANITHNLSSIKRLEVKIEMLDARVLKLEEIIVKVCNEEPVEEDIDWAEVGQQRRDDEEGWRDR